MKPRLRPLSARKALSRILQLAFQVKEIRCCYNHPRGAFVERKNWRCDCKYTFTWKDERFPSAPDLRLLGTLGEFTGCAEASEIAALARALLKELRKRKA